MYIIMALLKLRHLDKYSKGIQSNEAFSTLAILFIVGKVCTAGGRNHTQRETHMCVHAHTHSKEVEG